MRRVLCQEAFNDRNGDLYLWMRYVDAASDLAFGSRPIIAKELRLAPVSTCRLLW